MAQFPRGNVLVLNKYYAGIHVCSLARAVSLVYTRHAEIISATHGSYHAYSFEEWISASQDPSTFLPDHGRVPWIVTARIRFLAPYAIRLTQSGHIPSGTKQLRPTRNNIFLRDGYICQYCDRKYNTGRLNIDHIMPRSRGGRSVWENVVTSCVPCNTKKGGRLPEEAGMRLRRIPSKPNPNTFFRNKLDSNTIMRYGVFIGVAG